jgi:hypothetical protein
MKPLHSLAAAFVALASQRLPLAVRAKEPEPTFRRVAEPYRAPGSEHEKAAKRLMSARQLRKQQKEQRRAHKLERDSGV